MSKRCGSFCFSLTTFCGVWTLDCEDLSKVSRFSLKKVCQRILEVSWHLAFCFFVWLMGNCGKNRRKMSYTSVFCRFLFLVLFLMNIRQSFFFFFFACFSSFFFFLPKLKVWLVDCLVAENMEGNLSFPIQCREL